MFDLNDYTLSTESIENGQDAFNKSVTQVLNPHQMSLRQKGNSSIQQLSPRPYPGMITLNHNVRKKEVARINRENKAILAALKNAKPTLKSREWTNHFVKHQKIRENIKKFRDVGKSQPRPRIAPVIHMDD